MKTRIRVEQSSDCEVFYVERYVEEFDKWVMALLPFKTLQEAKEGTDLFLEIINAEKKTYYINYP